MSKLRILLGDDHTLIRSGLRKILQERPDWEVVAEAGNGRDAVREALALEPDLAILDISMPLLNGIEATAQIVRRLPNLRVLILSMHANEAYIIQGCKLCAPAARRRDHPPAQRRSQSRRLVIRTTIHHYQFVDLAKRCHATWEVRRRVQNRDDDRQAQAEQLAPPSTQKRAQCG